MRSLIPMTMLVAVALAPVAQAQRATSIEARTAGELAELCATNPKDPLGDARINFCHGFAQGAIIVELRHAEGKKPFCLPNPSPSRTTTMAEFVSWVRTAPDRRSLPVIDGFFRFLGERFPCK